MTVDGVQILLTAQRGHDCRIAIAVRFNLKLHDGFDVTGGKGNQKHDHKGESQDQIALHAVTSSTPMMTSSFVRTSSQTFCSSSWL